MTARATGPEQATPHVPSRTGADSFGTIEVPARSRPDGPLVRFAAGSMNPQHLKLLSDWRDVYRYRIALAFAQHGPAQRGFAADDLNELSTADQLHAAAVRAEKELLLLVV
jgi:hypothetical protein